MNTISGKTDRADPESAATVLPGKTPATLPHALDGSQYHSIIEEQVYADQPPTLEEQKPWRIFHPDTEKPVEAAPDKPTISVGKR